MTIYGRAGTLKSWLMIDLAFAIAGGHKWLETFQTRKSSVLIVQAEQTEWQYQKRVIKYCQNRNGKTPDNIYFDNDLELKLDGFAGLQAILDDIKERKPDVVILDCLYQLVSGSVANEMDLKRFKDNVDKLRHQYKISFIIIHHTRKHYSEDDQGIEEMLTSSVFGNWLDTIVRIRGVPANADQPTVIQMDFQKVKDAEEEVQALRVGFDRETTQFHWR